MNPLWNILIYLLALAIGFVIQNLVRWSPRANLGISYLTILILPPFWGLGLVGGFWISCSFFTYNPEIEHRHDTTPQITWSKILLYSAWTFSGFLLTLILLWKLKTANCLLLVQREEIAWLFLTLVEVCQYKVIARISASFNRIPLGYGIAVLNFLMIFYWLYPLGLYSIILIFCSFLVINPLLLSWVDFPVNSLPDPYQGRNR